MMSLTYCTCCKYKTTAIRYGSQYASHDAIQITICKSWYNTDRDMSVTMRYGLRYASYDAIQITIGKSQYHTDCDNASHDTICIMIHVLILMGLLRMMCNNIKLSLTMHYFVKRPNSINMKIPNTKQMYLSFKRHLVDSSSSVVL